MILLAVNANAQDIHFSQFFETPLLRNPSLAGIFNGDLRIQGVYRNQWQSVTVPYKTGSFNFEYKKPVGHQDDFVTMGLQIVYDKAGSTNFTTTNILPAVNYHKSISANKNQYISLGFMGGLISRTIDRSKTGACAVQRRRAGGDERAFGPGRFHVLRYWHGVFNF